MPGYSERFRQGLVRRCTKSRSRFETLICVLGLENTQWRRVRLAEREASVLGLLRLCGAIVSLWFESPERIA